MYNSDYLIYFRPDEIEQAVKAALVAQVIPEIRAAIVKASDTINQEFNGGSPFANDFIQEKLIKQIADLFALDDLDDHIRPHQLSDAHLRYWFKVPAGEQSQ